MEVLQPGGVGVVEVGQRPLLQLRLARVFRIQPGVTLVIEVFGASGDALHDWVVGRFLPPGRGRGSAVSSVVCYLIGLSPVDPLAHNLYVGRFLNEELASVPDIDIDFPREIREAMIERM